MKNVIVVTADSLRADHCGWIADTDLTPNLDELAEDSLTFSSAISPGPRTLSSVPVSHTGTHFPHTAHDTSNYEERIARIQNHISNFDTISETFQNKGYKTVAFTANPWTSADNKFDTGFDTFREVSRDGGAIDDFFADTPFQMPARFFDQWFHKDKWFSQWRTFYTEIADTIEHTSGPVFAWIFLLDTHNPYIVPRKDRKESSAYGMYSGILKANDAFNQSGENTHYKQSTSEQTISKLRAAYRDSVRSVDTFVGRLFDDVDSKDTVLLFHSDHGEAFGEHGTFGHEPILYEENIHVPLLIYGINDSLTIEDPISTSHIPEIAYTCIGDAEHSPESWTSEYAFSRTEDSTRIAVRGERWKYIFNDGEELYDLHSDPDEARECSQEHPEIVEKLRSQKNDYLANLPEPTSETGSVTSEGMRDHLQSLGYLEK